MKEIVIYIGSLVLTVITSGALFTFIQFLIQRHDTKKNIEAKMDENDKKLSEKIDKLEENLGGRIDCLDDKFEEHRATLSRTHILRFADEQRQYVKAGMTHSEEYFKQQLQDIKTYDDYCEAHPKFKNNLTVIASEYIQSEYKRNYFNKLDG